VVVPYYDLVLLACEHQHNDIGLVHHLNEGDSLAEDLAFLFESLAARVILDDLEADVCGHREILLSLIARDVVDGLITREVEARLDVCALYLALFGLANFFEVFKASRGTLLALFV
jgi:hypothetical protein